MCFCDVSNTNFVLESLRCVASLRIINQVREVFFSFAVALPDLFRISRPMSLVTATLDHS
jgi:hypothetical protein